MKAPNNNITRISTNALCSIAFLTISLFANGQDTWKESNNWLNTIQHVMGSQTSCSWMKGICADADQIFESTDSKSFAVVVESEFADSAELLGDMESPIIDGSGTHLMPADNISYLEGETYKEEYAGTIANQRVQLIRISQLGEDGQITTVFMVFTDTVNQSNPLFESDQWALSLLNEDKMDSLSVK